MQKYATAEICIFCNIQFFCFLLTTKVLIKMNTLKCVFLVWFLVCWSFRFYHMLTLIAKSRSTWVKSGFAKCLTIIGIIVDLIKKCFRIIRWSHKTNEAKRRREKIKEILPFVLSPVSPFSLLFLLSLFSLSLYLSPFFSLSPLSPFSSSSPSLLSPLFPFSPLSSLSSFSPFSPLSSFFYLLSHLSPLALLFYLLLLFLLCYFFRIIFEQFELSNLLPITTRKTESAAKVSCECF